MTHQTHAETKFETTTELLLIRHAPAFHDGRLAGRRDVPADCSNAQAFAALRSAIGAVEFRIASPALRCLQTTAALWPELLEPETDVRLWEQDFGAWEELSFAAVPDLGTLPPEELVRYRAPSGESFAGLCERTAPALSTLAGRGGRIALVAHAGTVRAAMALALKSQVAALTFQVAPLSLTRLTVTRSNETGGTNWSIGCVNWTATAGHVR